MAQERAGEAGRHRGDHSRPGRPRPKNGGAKDVPFFDDYKKMLDETKPDIVWAFVENNRHLEILKECAPRHINVIYEKPLASTYKDALAMADLAKKYNVKVMCNYQMAWWPANLVAQAGGG